jgi:hypothetical protein
VANSSPGRGFFRAAIASESFERREIAAQNSADEGLAADEIPCPA